MTSPKNKQSGNCLLALLLVMAIFHGCLVIVFLANSFTTPPPDKDQIKQDLVQAFNEICLMSPEEIEQGTSELVDNLLD